MGRNTVDGSRSLGLSGSWLVTLGVRGLDRDGGKVTGFRDERDEEEGDKGMRPVEVVDVASFAAE